MAANPQKSRRFSPFFAGLSTPAIEPFFAAAKIFKNVVDPGSGHPYNHIHRRRQRRWLTI
jgi:hypothetical protein